MEKLKTRSGKEFPCDYFVFNQEEAYIRVFAPISTVAAVFSDPKETAQLWYGANYLANYTNLSVVILEGDAIKVCLAKE